MNLARKSFSVLQRDILLLGVSMGTSVLVARTLGPHMLGLWVILNLIPSYAETFGRLKVEVAAVFFLGKRSENYSAGDVVFLLNTVAIASGLLVTLPAVIFFDWFSRMLFGGDADALKVLIAVMLFQVPTNFIYMNYVYLHIQREDVRSLNVMVMTRALLAAALTVISLLWLEWGMAGLVFAQTAGLVCSVAIGIGKYGMPKRNARRIEPVLLRQLLSYSAKLYAGGMIAYLNTSASQAIVVAFCAPKEVAYFSIAQQFGQLVNKVTEALGTFLFSRISKTGASAQSADLAARAFRVALVILVPSVTTMAVMAGPVLGVLYGPAYKPVLVPLWLVLPGFTIAAAASTLSMFFLGVGRADLVAKAAVGPLIVQITVGLLLVSQLEIVGAALALLAALLTTAGLHAGLFLHVTRTSLRQQLFLRREDFDTVRQFIATLCGHLLRPSR